MELQEKLEKSLRIALAQKDMNKKQLAAKMGCKPAYITNIMKNGKLSVTKLNDVATTLDCSLWEFIKLGESL
tara:strand:- start:421 stop:636 length:216 start_codon:yes stop_codon:yes gene_type:complete